MHVQSYLFFNGRCEEALEFYKKALGAKVVMLMRFKDNPEQGGEACQGMPEGAEEKVMHASFRIGETEVMASDGRCTGEPSFDGFSLSISVNSEAEADRYFHALSEGGSTVMPLEKTFWSPKFGMLRDKFGVHWMVSVETTEGGQA